MDKGHWVQVRHSQLKQEVLKRVNLTPSTQIYKYLTNLYYNYLISAQSNFTNLIKDVCPQAHIVQRFVSWDCHRTKLSPPEPTLELHQGYAATCPDYKFETSPSLWRLRAKKVSQTIFICDLLTPVAKGYSNLIQDH